MVDRPDLNPQVFSKRSPQGVPRLTAQAPNFRAAPTVTAFAQGSVADTLVSMANDSNRLAAMQSQQFQVSQRQIEQAQAEIREQQVIEAEGELNKILMNAEQSISDVRLTSPIDGVAQDSMDAYDDVQRTSLDNANLSAFQRQYLGPKLDKARMSVAESAVKFQRAARQEEARNTLVESLQTREFFAAKNPDQLPLLLEEMDATIDEIGAGLSQSDRNALKDKQKERLTMAALSGQIETNPALASQIIAKEMGSDNPFGGAISLNQAIALEADAEVGIRKIQAEQNKIESAKRARVDAELGVAIATGELSQLPTFTSLTSLRDNGRITDAQWESHTKSLAKRLKDTEDENTDLNVGSVIFNNRLPVNPANKEAKKAFNVYYENQAPLIAQMPVEQRIQHSVDVIKTHRAVPDMLKGEIELAATSGDPEQVSIAAEMVERIAKEAPYLMDKVISTKDRQRIDMINQRLNIGAEPKEAITQTDQQLSILNQASNEQIGQELQSLKQGVDFRQKTVDAMDTILDEFKGFGGGIVEFAGRVAPFVSGPDLRAAAGLSPLDAAGAAQFDIDRAAATYQLAFEDAYRQTRDANLAERRAKEQTQARFGRSTINGAAQILEFPPEQYYSIKGEDNDWMRDQMLGAAREVLGDSLTGEDALNRVRLLPDPYLTPRTAKESRPGYNMVLIGEDGVPRLLNQPGQLFYFDPALRKQELLDEAREPGVVGKVLETLGFGGE